MEVMHVREYNRTIAKSKFHEAHKRWSVSGYGYPSRNMFYFYLPDNYTLRRKGYISFDDVSATFSLSKPKGVL